MSNTPLTTNGRNRLIRQIVPLLTANGTGVRGVIDMADRTLPSGPNIMGKLLDRFSLDGLRCEVMGTTLTIEVTSKRTGEQVDEDAGDQMRYATSDYQGLKSWLFSKLRQSGIEPNEPRPISQPGKSAYPIKMDLRSKPFIPKSNRNQSRR